MTIIEDTPETMVRSDLWTTMSLSELQHQQELMITKMSAVQAMAGSSASPSVLAMYSAMQHGSDMLQQIIDNRAVNERK